ncbi:MAG TPA: electron transfer flavoprotein subunit beta/FixA family protein [Actinomycetota bacterium]|nr:electron transfer flavoprotein subunit beta/FixA family protein [Actinomycetota bacterium]
MNVVVCAKYVPEPEGTPKLGPDNLLVREGVNGALDAGDEVGVELALQLVEAQGGEVIVVSMGPDDAATAVQRALAMGAHRGVLVTDPRLRGADALVTAKVLAAAIAKQPHDLVVAGVESADGYTGTMPAAMAELLGLPSVTIARKVELDANGVRVERQTEAGYDVLSCPLPAVVTLTLGANEPRYPSLKGIMQAKQKPVERLSLDDLGLGDDDVASTQRVTGAEDAPPKPGGEIVEGDDGVAKIADLLTEAKVI